MQVMGEQDKKKARIDIISGFLGAGKTTWLNEVLGRESLAGTFGKTVIIENEFGDVGVDGSRLKTEIEIKELNSGCICCSLKGDFSEAIGQCLTDLEPDRIIIEPSGVAKLSEVIGACKEVSMKHGVNIGFAMTCIDATQYAMYLENFGEFYENQIEHADLLVMSRSQHLTPQELVSVTEELRRVNASAPFVVTPWTEIGDEALLELFTTDNSKHRLFEPSPFMTINRMNIETGANTKDHVHEHDHEHSAAAFQFVVFDRIEGVSEDQLKNGLQALKKECHGKIIRAKGSLPSLIEKEWHEIDWSGDQIEIKSVDPGICGRLVFIGTDLDREAIICTLKTNIN